LPTGSIAVGVAYTPKRGVVMFKKAGEITSELHREKEE